MARAPGWQFELPGAARWVLAFGCPSAVDAPPAPLGEREWNELVDASARHRLEGLLVHAVAAEALPVTPDQSEQVAHLEIELTRSRMWQEQRLGQVVSSIDAAEVPVLVLKGLALATLDYPDPQMRPTGDVDLLVRGADLPAVAAALEAMGATRLDPDPVPRYAETVGKGATFASPQGEVDVHRLLVWGPLGVRLDPELLWSRTRSFVVGGRTFGTLGLEETVVHACAHLLVLGWRRALSLRDIAQLLLHDDLDVDRLLRVARAWDAEALLAEGLLLTQRELHLLLPEGLEAWATGYPVTLRDRLWLRVERPGAAVPGIESLATYVELPSPGARAVLRRATLAPMTGTWPSPRQRVATVGHKVTAALARPVRRPSARR